MTTISSGHAQDMTDSINLETLGQTERSRDFTDPYSHYDDIDPYTCKSLEPEQYLICDYKVWACVLKTREWGKVAIWSNSSTITKTKLAQSCST